MISDFEKLSLPTNTAAWFHVSVRINNMSLLGTGVKGVGYHSNAAYDPDAVVDTMSSEVPEKNDDDEEKKKEEKKKEEKPPMVSVGQMVS